MDEQQQLCLRCEDEEGDALEVAFAVVWIGDDGSISSPSYNCYRHIGESMKVDYSLCSVKPVTWIVSKLGDQS